MSFEAEAPSGESAGNTPAAPATTSRSSYLGANFLIAVGVALAAGGAAFAASQHVSWALYRIARQVAGYGVAFDALCVIGVGLIGVGVIARLVTQQSRRLREVSDGQIDLALLVDQVLLDLTDVRAGIDQLAASREVDGVQTAAAAIEGQNEKDALFRMAASLDQLSGRLTQRVAQDMTGVRTEIERLTQTLSSLASAPAAPNGARQASVEVVVEPAAEAPAKPVPAEPVPAPMAAPVAKAAPPQVEEPVAEDDAVVVDLDAEDAGLGVLDELAAAEEEAEPISINIYDPPPALPKPAASEDAERKSPQSYQSSLDRLLPDDRIHDALDENR